MGLHLFGPQPVWFCTRCNKWWQRVQNISCCVVHALDQCCHMGEREMVEPQPIDKLPPGTSVEELSKPAGSTGNLNADNVVAVTTSYQPVHHDPKTCGSCQHGDPYDGAI